LLNLSVTLLLRQLLKQILFNVNFYLIYTFVGATFTSHIGDIKMHKTNFTLEMPPVFSIDVDVTFEFDDFDSSVGEKESVTILDVVFNSTDEFEQDNPISLDGLLDDYDVKMKLEDYLLKNKSEFM